MKRWLAVLSVILATACSDEVVAPRQDALLSLSPTLYHFDASAFDAADKSASFWAVKGQDREVSLRYSDTNDAFLTFKVGAQSLAYRPNGTPFADGDSVLITINTDANGAMSFSFEPSGLIFDRWHPAELTIDAARRDRDVNGDGVINVVDTLLDTSAAIWCRNLDVLPWVKLPTLHLLGSVYESDVVHFTDFGMAVN